MLVFLRAIDVRIDASRLFATSICYPSARRNSNGIFTIKYTLLVGLMAYTTEQITDQLLDDTKKSWELVVGVDEFTSEYGALFDWLQCHRQYQGANGHSVAYALVQEGQKVASAFIEVVSSPNRGGLTKLLKVFVTPLFWDVADHQAEVVKLFVMAIRGAVDISNQNGSRTVKIYGRSNSLLSLLHTIHVAMIEDGVADAGISVTIQGRWLVISTI